MNTQRDIKWALNMYMYSSRLDRYVARDKEDVFLTTDEWTKNRVHRNHDGGIKTYRPNNQVNGGAK